MSSPHDQPDTTVPLAAEELRIERRLVETDHVRVRTVTDEVAVRQEAEVTRGEIDVERVAVERQVDTAPAPYEENGVLVVPIVEERLVIEKRLFVVEELRIRPRHVTETVPIDATLRRQRAVIEQEDPTTTGEANDRPA